MPDATEIARGLSKAQRKALLWLPADGQPRLGWPAAHGTQAALLRLRLVARWMVARSVEDHARYSDRGWRPDEPCCVHDAFSLTVGRHRFGAGVFDHVPGLEVRAILAAEAEHGEG